MGRINMRRSESIKLCKAGFPCLCDIFVLAGLDEPCESCREKVDKIRPLQGYMKVGDYWQCVGLTNDQQREIDKRIAAAEGPVTP